MNTIRKELRGIVREADGFEGVEYAALTALIVASIVAALVSLGVALNGNFSTLTQVIRF
jgi:Flp pilus assembly pilin Flp